MLIECHICNAKVDALEIGQHNDEDFIAIRTYLLKCPSCNSALIAESEEGFANDKQVWSRPIRVYPKPKRPLGADIPPIVKHSIDEADRCMQVGAHTAATAMCGRALEAICRYYQTSDTYLGRGLKELRDKGIIDSRLFQWSEELRDQRNNAAHATDSEINFQDANDIMTFSYAIIDYVFLLTQKFEQFQLRKKKRAEKKSLSVK